MENKNEEKLALAAPWETFYKEIAVLLGDDPEITIKYDADEPEVKLFVRNGRKADALAKLLPVERTFGNVTLRVTVLPDNDGEERLIDSFRDAFAGNPALSYVTEGRLPGGGDVGFVVFKNKVVQFFNDDMTDLYGNRSTLYQDIAYDVFGGHEWLYFNTDLEGNPGHPITGKEEK